MLQEAYAVALQKMAGADTPANPRTWLISTARNKAIDQLRRDRRFEFTREEIERSVELTAPPSDEVPDEVFPDDRFAVDSYLLAPVAADGGAGRADTAISR
jgi:RNA polymerase sigma-70 factor (ECF subfamily)